MGTCVIESVHCAPSVPPGGVVRRLGGGRDTLDLGGCLRVPHAKPSALCRGQVCQGTLQAHSHRAALKWGAQPLQCMDFQVCLACSCLLAQSCAKLHSMDAQKKPKDIRSSSFYMPKLTSDTNRVHEESMSVVCKLDQYGLASMLGPGRHRWQPKAFESGCLA